jgi:hypothetical protein
MAWGDSPVNRKIQVVVLGILVLSVSYNALWLASAESMLESVCVAQVAAVKADAFESHQARHWDEARMLYAYLLAYRPDGPRGCRALGITKADWTLPLVSLALRARYRLRTEDREWAAQLEATELERAFDEASANVRASESPRG